MSSSSQLLGQCLRRYRLNLGGSSVWVPYWINSDNPPFSLNAPLRGKGDWREIGLAARAAARTERIAPQSAEEWRLLMRRHGIGIDCSGLVFHVLTDWFVLLSGKKLADSLMITQAEISDRNARISQLGTRWQSVDSPLARLPGQPSLGDACRRWAIDPASICNVRRFVDPQLVHRVDLPIQLRPADLIVTSIGSTNHIGMVIRVGRQKVWYADSAHDAGGGLGGVRLRSITIHRPTLGLEAQAWDQQGFYNPGEQGRLDGMWRLNILQELQSGC